MIQTNEGTVDAKGAFLDTNAIVNMFDFWISCRSASVRLDTVKKWATLKSALGKKDNLTAHLSAEDARNVKIGMGCFWNLTCNREFFQYFTSTVCLSELHHVLLDALALERLVSHKVPHRLRVVRPQVLYGRALERDDYSELQSDMDEFLKSLHLDYGIELVQVEQPASGTTVTFADVWSTAQEIWSRIRIDVMDSYIYASAVEIEADLFITSDGGLIDALGHFRNPTGEWISATKSLKFALGKPDCASLPLPMRPTHQFPSN